MQFWFNSDRFLPNDQDHVGGDNFSRCSVFHSLDENQVAGIFVEYHDVLHTSVGPYWKLPRLVGVHFQLKIVVEIVDSVVGIGIGWLWLVAQRFLLFFDSRFGRSES